MCVHQLGKNLQAYATSRVLGGIGCHRSATLTITPVIPRRYEQAKTESQVAYCLDLHALDADIRTKGLITAPAFLLSLIQHKIQSLSSNQPATRTAQPDPSGAAQTEQAVTAPDDGSLAPACDGWGVRIMENLLQLKQNLTISRARERMHPDKVGKRAACIVGCQA